VKQSAGKPVSRDAAIPSRSSERVDDPILKQDVLSDTVTDESGQPGASVSTSTTTGHRLAGIQPLLLDARAVAQLIAVSESTFWKLHSMGRLPMPIRLTGRVVRWRRDELESWVRAGCPARDKWTFGEN
jgi:predicted DNA-binding transcriptional regulator AlpA